MSTHIIDQIAAVKFPKERTGYYDDYYILATEGGDNNCIDCDTNRRARNWSPRVAGEHYRCLAWACGVAADVCGGCVRFAHGPTTPESFIKRFRAVLDAAPDYYDPAAARSFRVHQTAITFTAEEKAEGSFYFEQCVAKKGAPELRDKVYLRGDVEAFPFSFTEPREAALFIELLPYKAPLWHHLSIAA